jgi:hypothetical protein
MHLPGPFRLDRFGMAKEPDSYSDKEAQARFEAALKGALKTAPKPLKDKPRVKKAKKAKKK